jgi:hypothetical protein
MQNNKFIFIILMMIIFSVLSCTDLMALERNDTIHNPKDSILQPKNVANLLILTPYHLNVIKFNPTPMLLFSDIRNLTFSYERLINNNHSLAIQLGYLMIPQWISDTVANLVTIRDDSRKGINIGFDYRYYPSLRNRHPAPDGLYLGSYLSYYGFRFEDKFNAINEPAPQDGSIKGRLNMTNLGFEIGYQFIFRQKFSVDLLMFGPSITYYSSKIDIDGNLEEGQIDEIDQEFADRLFKRFPALSYLFDGETTNLTNTKFHLTTGFRYCIQFGFHF